MHSSEFSVHRSEFIRKTPKDRFDHLLMELNCAIDQSGLSYVFSQPEDEPSGVDYTLTFSEVCEANHICTLWNGLCKEIGILRRVQFSPPERFHRRFCHFPTVFAHLNRANDSFTAVPQDPPFFEDAVSRETLDFRTQVAVNMVQT